MLYQKSHQVPLKFTINLRESNPHLTTLICMSQPIIYFIQILIYIDIKTLNELGCVN